MQNRNINVRQLLALLFAGLLSPAAGILPRETAFGGAWLSPLLALPAALAVGWIYARIFRRLPASEGFAGALRLAFGSAAARAVTGLYLLWTLLLLAVNTWLAGRRLLSAGYRLASPAFFLAIILAVVLWLGLGQLSRLAAAGEVFFLILSIAVGAVLLLALPHIQWDYVLQVQTQPVAGTAAASAQVLQVLLFAAPAAFLGGEVTRHPGDPGRAARWMGGFCGLLTLLLLAIQGQFGPTLTARLSNPFFKLVAGIGIRGAFQRLEAVLSALWVVGDLALLSLFVLACRSMVSFLLNGKQAKWTAVIAVILALFGGLRLLSDPKLAEAAAGAVRLGGLLLAVFVPALVLLALTVQKRP